MNFCLQSLLKTADQLKIKGLCEVPESREGASVHISSPEPRETSTPRPSYAKLKHRHPRYKRLRAVGVNFDSASSGRLQPQPAHEANRRYASHGYPQDHPLDRLHLERFKEEEEFVDAFARDCDKEVSHPRADPLPPATEPP